jgi:hypothetical protein
VTRAAAVLLVLALALGSCGGGGDDDADQAKQVVRDFVTATNDHDGDRLCGKLLAGEYIRTATGATGDKGRDACKRQLDLLTGLRLKLVRIESASADGDEATVRATLVASGQRGDRIFRLKKEDGSWKLASGHAAPQ